MKRLALGIVLLLVLAACGDDDAATTITISPEASALGLEVYQGDGFSILMPDSWFVLEGDDIDIEAMFEGLPESFGEDIPASFLEQAEFMFSQGGAKIWAFDFLGASPVFTDNLLIVVSALPPLRISEVESINVQDVEAIGASDIESEIRSLPAGEAVIFRYNQPASLGGGQGTSVILLTETAQWSFTLTALDLDRHSEVFELMIESFREAS